MVKDSADPVGHILILWSGGSCRRHSMSVQPPGYHSHSGMQVTLSVLLLQHIVWCQGLSAPTWETKKKCFTGFSRHPVLSKKKKKSLQTRMLPVAQLREILCMVNSAWEGRLCEMDMWAEVANPSNRQSVEEVNCKKIWCVLSKVLHPLQFAVATAVKALQFFSIVIPCSVFCSRETFSSAWILHLFELVSLYKPHSEVLPGTVLQILFITILLC